MATLSGQTIQSTDQGLLKLDNSTTGITNILQHIQDGLGNNTGMRIATNQLEATNIQSFINLKSQYYGSGFQSTAAAQMGAGTQNIILAYPFIDKGQYSYSALTLNLITATSTSDTCEAAIYTPQLINPYGLYPHAPIISGLTIPTTGSTGQKTVVFPSNISMSGYGGGIYWIVFKVSNAGVQPTVRFGTGIATAALGSAYGMISGLTANQYVGQYRSNGSFMALSGQTTFDNPFGTNLISLQSTTASIAGSNLGVLLHTVDY
jgi:hypothetical protein